MQGKIHKQLNGLQMEKNYLTVRSGHRTWCLGRVTFLSSPVLKSASVTSPSKGGM